MWEFVFNFLIAYRNFLIELDENPKLNKFFNTIRLEKYPTPYVAIYKIIHVYYRCKQVSWVLAR